MAAAAASLGMAAAASAATFNLDFTQDPTASGQVTLFGSAVWRDTGGNTGGYLSVTDAMDSQRGAIVFGDLDNGLVVQAFSFSVDVRIGGGSATPADGFSINYVRAGDDVLDDGEGWSDIGNTGDLNLPEEGAKTGLAIGFDSYLSGGGTVADVIGLSVRVDNVLLAQYAFPSLNGQLADTNSLQTGPLNPAYVDGTSPIEDSWANLGWAKFEVNLAVDGKLTIKYKGREVTPAGGLQTTFFPSPGQLVFAGRTGAENQNHHIDNIQITTIAAEAPFFSGLSGTAVGFTFDLSDGGTQVDTNTVQVKLNGQDVTLSSLSKSGNTTRGVYTAPTLLTAGATNNVTVTFRDSAGREIVGERSFVVRSYQVLGASEALPANAVDRNAPGFTARISQLPIARFPGDANSINNAEKQLAGRFIDPATGQPYANRADLTGATAGLFVIPDTINWNQDVNTAASPTEIGSFQSTSDPSRPDTQIPGIPGPILNPDETPYTDNIAAEILTYLELKRGLYRFGVNSDDGFRVTAGSNYRDVFAKAFGSFNTGKGSSDELFDIYVEADGVYPFRLAWWEGDGGANLEFFHVDEANNRKILINDREVSGHVPAFRTSTAAALSYVSFAGPMNGETGVLPNPAFVVDIQDGTPAVDDSSIVLSLNGAALAVTNSNSGAKTTVSASAPALLPSGSTNALRLVYKTAGSAQSVTQEWSFVTTTYVTLPASTASPLGSGNTNQPGFVGTVYQLEPWLNADGTASAMPTELYWADAMVSGAAGPNVANLAEAANGKFHIDGVINFEQDAAAAGAFGGDTSIPGIPGSSSAVNDNIAGEFSTFVEFPTAGAYQLGVNSDDGFRVTAGEGRGSFLLNILAPAAVAGPQAAVLSARGVAGGTYGPLPSAPITADIIYTTPGDACADFSNAAQLPGKIALVDRGTCGFVDKARRAQLAGAVAMIIINNNPAFPFVAGGGTDEITIPVVMIGRDAGALLKANLNGLRGTLGPDTAPLLGEFNGGRGSAGTAAGGTLFTVNVPQPGVYPLRLLWMEGGGGASVEWYSITAGGQAVLLNDRSNPNALKTYRSRTVAERPTLGIAVSNDRQSVTLNFSGTLEAAATVDGTYSPVTGSSPLTVPATGQMRFFRARR